MPQRAEYQPQFWIFGSVDPNFMPRARELGFVGVGFWAADRDGERIKYYFDSPTLEQVDWACGVASDQSATTYDYAGLERQGRGLAEYAVRAHAAGLKVMANMEGVNPYHWEAGRTKWTPEIISGVAEDLHRGGADRWFTECVAGWPALFEALAATCRRIGMEYQEGSDPGYLHQWDSETGGFFVRLAPQASMVSMYHYHYKRDEMGKLASLAQEGSLAYAFARGWGLPTALVYTVGHDWGESPEDWEGILKASIIIRALQFRTRDIMIIGETEEKARQLDVPGMTRWLRELVAKQQEERRPLLNVVAHLRTGAGSHWRDLATSGDAIASGAFHAGWDVVATTAPLSAADAYYVYTAGADQQGVLDLTPGITALFAGDKPVFLQIGWALPSGAALTPAWREALSRCGVDPAGAFEEGNLPSTGTYEGQRLRYTGVYTAYTLTDRRHGALVPTEAITGDVLASGDSVPLIVGRGDKYLIPANCLSWQMMYPIGHLLSGSGALPSSDVWGIAGEQVSAFLAIHDTVLEVTLPRLSAGRRLRLRQWDRRHQQTHEELLTYTGSLRRDMAQFDFVLIEALP